MHLCVVMTCGMFLVVYFLSPQIYSSFLEVCVSVRVCKCVNFYIAYQSCRVSGLESIGSLCTILSVNGLSSERRIHKDFILFLLLVCHLMLNKYCHHQSLFLPCQPHTHTHKQTEQCKPFRSRFYMLQSFTVFLTVLRAKQLPKASHTHTHTH